MSDYFEMKKNLIDDPRKAGIPPFLQVQNRKEPTPEQQRKIDEMLAKAKLPTPSLTIRMASEEDKKIAEEILAEKKRIADLKFKVRIAKAQDVARVKPIPGSTWDQKTCKWVHPSIKPEKDKDMTQLEDKTIPQLTAEYNAIAKAKGKKTVLKFKDKKTALRRLEEINGASATSEESQSKKEDGNLRKQIIDQFGFRANSTREVLLNKLIDHLGQQVTKEKLGEYASSISGIEWKISGSPREDGTVTKQKLPFELKTSKENGVISYGLYQKGVLRS